MKASHRTFIGGSFGALAAATVAASAAYACHPIQILELSSTAGHPGTVVRVEAWGFEPGREMEFRWGTRERADLVVGSSHVQTTDRVSGRAQAWASVTVPSDAAIGNEYAIVGYQAPLLEGDPPKRTQPKLFTVTAPPEKPAPQQPPATVEEGVPATGVEQPPVDPANDQPAAQPPLQGNGPAASVAPARTEPPAARPASSGSGTPAQATPAPAVAPDVAADPAAARPALPATVPAAAPLPGTAEPTANDLWSALAAPDGTPSLLDAQAPVSKAKAPIGAVLLGLGVIALAGVALAAGRRRLALAVRR